MKKSYFVLFFSLVAAVLLMSACSQPITGPTGGSSLTPLQVLQSSANAMQQLKSAHIEIQSTNSLQTANATATVGTPAATPTGTPIPRSFSLTVNGSGEEALPDQEQLSLTVNQNIHLAEIVQGNKVYVQNAQGQWYVLDKSAFQSVVGNPFSGVNFDQQSLLALIQHAQITDHGTEALNGQNLRHITAILDKEALRQLLASNPQLVGGLGKQNIDAVLNNTKSFLSSVDVWIDEAQFYVHRTELKLNLVANTSNLSSTSTLPSSITTNLDTIVDLSKFNVPVVITPPASAIPTNNPGAILGLGAYRR